MNNWEYIINFYSGVASRTIPELAEFGRRMLKLVRELQSQEGLADLIPGTAVYTLTLNTAGKDTNIFVSWSAGDGYMVRLNAMRGKLTQEVFVTEEELLPTIKRYVRELKLDTTQ